MMCGDKVPFKWALLPAVIAGYDRFNAIGFCSPTIASVRIDASPMPKKKIPWAFCGRALLFRISQSQAFQMKCIFFFNENGRRFVANRKVTAILSHTNER